MLHRWAPLHSVRVITGYQGPRVFCIASSSSLISTSLFRGMLYDLKVRKVTHIMPGSEHQRKCMKNGYGKLKGLSEVMIRLWLLYYRRMYPAEPRHHPALALN